MEIVSKHFSHLTIDELYEILKMRCEVFVLEQNCPYLDIDGLDKDAYHIFLKDGDKFLASLRVLPKKTAFDKVSIGRVLCTERRRGYATLILKEAIKTAREKLGADTIVLEAQTYAVSLYEKLGFKIISDEFLEDGIPHVKMELK